MLIPSKAPATATEPSPSKSIEGKFCAVLGVVKYAKEETRVERTTDAPRGLFIVVYYRLIEKRADVVCKSGVRRGVSAMQRLV